MLLTRRVLLGSPFASLISRAAWAEPSAPRILTARKATCRILSEPATETAILGFEGQVPGPLLRCKKGEEIKIRLVNQADQPLTFACQGMRLENAMDGVAGLTQHAISPTESFEYRIAPPDAGFNWYRSFVAPGLVDQLRQGLYGPFIVDEPDPPVADRDIVVVLADWRLDQGGQIASDSLAPVEPKSAGSADKGLGTLTTVNSKPIPVAETLPPGMRVRLRLLNAVSARVMFVAFSGVQPLVIAIDGQPCDAFQPLQRMLPIGPGARFDVMFDLPATAGAEAALVLRSAEGPDHPLLTFKMDGEKRQDLPPIPSLPQNPLLPRIIKLEASRKIDLIVAGGGKPTAAPTDPTPPFTLDGATAKDFSATPLFSLKQGTPVTLGFVNSTEVVQQMHVHGHHFRLLHDLDDGWEPYWRDNVIVPEGRTKHVAFVADNPGKWAIECLALGPRSTTMVTWFEVS